MTSTLPRQVGLESTVQGEGCVQGLGQVNRASRGDVRETCLTRHISRQAQGGKVDRRRVLIFDRREDSLPYTGMGNAHEGEKIQRSVPGFQTGMTYGNSPDFQPRMADCIHQTAAEPSVSHIAEISGANPTVVPSPYQWRDPNPGGLEEDPYQMAGMLCRRQ